MMYLFTEFDDPYAFFFWDGTDLLFIVSHDFYPSCLLNTPFSDFLFLFFVYKRCMLSSSLK